MPPINPDVAQTQEVRQIAQSGTDLLNRMKQATETWLATNPEAPIAALHTGVVSFNLHILQTYWKAGRKDCAEDFLFALTAAIDYFEKEATRGEAPPT